MLRRASALLVLSCLSELGHAVRQSLAPIKIACVGDSITAGFPFDSDRGSDQSVSGYPWHLGQLLQGGQDGQRYEVRNFGRGETTVVSGSKSWNGPWYQEALQSALAFKPDKVVLMFGANDVKANRVRKLDREFEAEYTKLIKMFEEASVPPSEIYVVIPPPMYDDNIYGPEFKPPGGAGGMQQDIYNERIPKGLRQLVQSTSVQEIDVRGCFLRHASCDNLGKNCCDWETRKPPKRNDPRTAEEVEAQPCLAHDDAIHPNDEGYRNIALMVKRAAVDEEAPC